MNILLIIDGNALMHRAYHALPPFKTTDGTQTNAVYGFITMLHKTVDLFKPTHLAVCFDRPEKTFRKKLYAEYQIQRPKTENELISQFPLVKNVLDAAHIKRYEKAGIEADDIIGTIVSSVKKDTKSYILSGDKDMFQLVNKHTFVISPHMGISDLKIYDIEAVIKRFSILPKQIPDFKSLMGDTSDNYKGVSGIGPKTAGKLLNTYQTLENVYKHIDDIKTESIKQALMNEKKHALLSKKLATIIANAKIEFSLEETKFTGYPKELKKEFEKLEFYSLIKRFFPTENKELSIQTKKQPVSNQQSLF